MFNLFRMHLRRLFHRKVLYIMMIVLVAIVSSTVALAEPGTNIAAALGIGDASVVDFLASNSGIGFINMLLGIIVTMFVYDDYASGYIKNIFAVHAKKQQYVGSLLLTMGIASAVLISTFFVAMFVLAAILAKTITIETVMGLVLLILQKWLISFAFSSIVLFVALLTRNKGTSIIAALLFGSGGLVVGLGILFEMIGVNGALITDSTIFGTAQLITLSQTPATVVRVVLFSALWTALYAAFSQKLLKSRDV